MNAKSATYLTILQSIGILVTLMGLLYLSSILFYLAAPAGIRPSISFLVPYITGSAIALWIFIQFRNKYSTKKKFNYAPVEIKAVLLIALATFVLVTGIIYPLSTFIPVSETTRLTLQNAFGAIDGWMLIAMIIAAPFFEEHIFRGVMLDGLLRNYNEVVALTVSSILFGIFHINPIQFMSAFIGGIFLGWIYLKSKNMSYCMFIHFIVNLVGYFMIKGMSLDTMLEVNVTDLFGGFWRAVIYISLSCILFTVSVYILNRLLKKPKALANG